MTNVCVMKLTFNRIFSCPESSTTRKQNKQWQFFLFLLLLAHINWFVHVSDNVVGITKEYEVYLWHYLKINSV